LDGDARQLWQVTASRGRATARLEMILRGPTELRIAPKPRPKKPASAVSAGIDWRHIAEAIAGNSDHSRADEWRRSARALLALKLKTGRPRHDEVRLAVPTCRKCLGTIDHHWKQDAKL